jgi:hypothetical protein
VGVSSVLGSVALHAAAALNLNRHQVFCDTPAVWVGGSQVETVNTVWANAASCESGGADGEQCRGKFRGVWISGLG